MKLIGGKRWNSVCLFYISPVVLKNIIDEDKYRHFITLHYSMSLLSKFKDQDDIEYARIRLKYFIKSFIRLNGSENVSHHVHN